MVEYGDEVGTASGPPRPPGYNVAVHIQLCALVERTQFDRLVGLVKWALYKGIRRASLFWKELEEMLLNVEVTLNNQPLCYVEDDVQLPVLTSSAMFGQPKPLTDEDLDEETSRYEEMRRTFCGIIGLGSIIEGEAQPKTQNQGDGLFNQWM